MNKLELISALREKADLSRAEAAGVMDLIFDKMPETLARVIGWKSGDYAVFMSRDTMTTPAEIRKPARS